MIYHPASRSLFCAEEQSVEYLSRQNARYILVFTTDLSIVLKQIKPVQIMKAEYIPTNDVLELSHLVLARVLLEFGVAVGVDR